MPSLYISILLSLFVLSSCSAQNKAKDKTQSSISVQKNQPLKVAAENISQYIDSLKGKRIAVSANQTSMIDNVHLIDSLLSLGVDIKKIFGPEHGFRGKADAGEKVSSHQDSKTGLPIVSLYGRNKKPEKKYLEDVDIVLFDIQDVGVRFYTYISTLHYIMEACAEQGVKVIVLDRPNPNGHYIDGPVLEKEHESFVGIHPVPIVHGLTIGEFALMINGEGWLKDGIKCNLQVVPCSNYTHDSAYSLPVKPSPNLPNDLSIQLYPSLGFFEGTEISVGRGTDKAFQIIGSPDTEGANFEFTPQSTEGAKYPPHENKKCFGYDFTSDSLPFPVYTDRLNIQLISHMYSTYSDSSKFFNNFFTKLAGTEKLKQQIKNHTSEKEIRASWKKDLDQYKKIRKKYLLYK